MLNVRVKKALLTILTACLTVLMTIGAILGFTPTTQTVKAAAGDKYTLVTDASTLAVGDTVIIVAKDYNYALSTTQNKNNRGQASVTKSGTNVTFTSAVQTLTLKAGKKTNTFAFYTGSGYLYAASTSSNYLKTETTLSDNSSWSISITTAGVATIKAQGTNTKNVMQYNKNSSLFAAYGSASQQAISIYKLVVNTCNHAETKAVYNATTKKHDITCTNTACNAIVRSESCVTNTIYTSNNDGTHNYTTICTANCGYSVSDTEGCDFKTETDGATTTFTCQKEGCGYSYSTTEKTYTVSFCVPEGITAVESTPVVNGNTIVELPTADAPAGYEFIGWVTKENQGIKAEAPEVFDASTEITEDIKLYALYKYEKAGNTKITSVDQLEVGMTLVIADKDGSKALSTNQASNNRTATDFNHNNENVQHLTLEAGTDSGYALSTGSGYLYTASNTANRLHTKTKKDNECDWTISFDNGVVSIKSVTNKDRGVMQFNPNNGSPIFNCYASASQIALSLWKIEDPIITYTTLQFGFANMTLKDELTMNYKVAMDDEIAKEAEMTFTMADNTTKVTGTKVDGLYVYSLQVAPQYMGENITAVLKLGDTVLASKATYSVKEYAESLINDEKSTNEVKQLASDLLLYGAAAQAHTGHDTEHLVADLNNLGAAPTKTDFSLVNAEVENGYPVYFTGANLNFSSLNTLYVTLSKYDEKVELYVNGEKVDLINNIYSTGTLQATQFNDTFTFVLKYDGIEMQTLTYSVNAYAYQFASGEGTMADLARALYNYGASVEAYVATLATQN